MRGLLRLFAAVILCASTIVPAYATDWYVKATALSGGDGSKNSPFDSLSDAQTASGVGDSIYVLHVPAKTPALDGGIVLKDGQSLIGTGPNPTKSSSKSARAKITNSAGTGITLARNNRVENLHVADTWLTGIGGFYAIQPTGGDVIIRNLLVTGANQSRSFNEFGLIEPSLGIGAVEDMQLRIENSEIGEADAPSIAIGQFNGHADVQIDNTLVRDQGHVRGSFDASSGISVATLGTASADVLVLDTTVSNIGDDDFSNSDGLLLQNLGSGAMTARVDGYRYSNPNGKGAVYTSTGIEMGCLSATAVGCSFTGTVTNSVITDAFLAGIQVVDAEIGDGPGSSNTVTVDIRDNFTSGSLVGIYSLTVNPFGRRFLNVVGNTVENSSLLGMLVLTYGSEVAEVFIESNSIVNSGEAGMVFEGDPNGVLLLDAGLGALGSAGQNRIIGSGVDDIVSVAVPVSAAGNWWGSDAGPTSVLELNGGAVDVVPFLESDPQ